MAEHRSDLEYGLDAELKAKEAAKHDPMLEKMVIGYLEELSGSKCDQAFFEMVEGWKNFVCSNEHS